MHVGMVCWKIWGISPYCWEAWCLSHQQKWQFSWRATEAHFLLGWHLTTPDTGLRCAVISETRGRNETLSHSDYMSHQQVGVLHSIPVTWVSCYAWNTSCGGDLTISRGNLFHVELQRSSHIKQTCLLSSCNPPVLSPPSRAVWGTWNLSCKLKAAIWKEIHTQL